MGGMNNDDDCRSVPSAICNNPFLSLLLRHDESSSSATSKTTLDSTTPTRLFGRDVEIDMLQQAFARSKSPLFDRNEVALIRGPSGTGKSALAFSLRPDVLQEGGFFISGKFELAQRQDPYAVFVSALTQFIKSLVQGADPNNPDERFTMIRASIQQRVGNEGGLLTQLFPSLAKVIGEQEKTGSIAGAEAKHRFQFAFFQLVQAISAVSPLVLFVDDIQWGDQASLDLLRSLLQLGEQSLIKNSLLYVLTLRDSNTSTDEDLVASFLDDIRLQARVTEISIQDFERSQFNNVVSGMLQLPEESTQSLARFVYGKSGGNIFRSLQVLRQLKEDQILFVDPQTQAWTWSDNELHEESTKVDTSEEVPETVCHRKLNKVSPFTRELLQAAACMVDVVDEVALTIYMDNQADKVIQSIEAATREELLVFLPRTGRYSFAHDQIRQAVLSTVLDVDKLSFQIGYKLMMQSSPPFLDTIVFMVASLINRGMYLLPDRTERNQAASLNLEAGLKAVSKAAFPDACRYLEAGVAFLQGFDYWAMHYQLSLDLFNSLTEAQLCCQNFERVAELVREMLANARSDVDKIRAIVFQMHAIGQHSHARDAVEVGINALKKLGVPITAQANHYTIIREMVTTKSSLKGRSSDAMMSAPFIKDELKHGAIHLLSVLIPYTFQAGSPLTVIIATRLVQLCLKFGMCKECSMGFVTLSWILCKVDRKEGYRIGRIGLSIVERLGARELIPRTHTAFYFFTSHWIRNIRESLGPLQNAYRVGIEIGDVEYAMFAALFHAVQAFHSGMDLPQVESLLVEAKRQMRLYKQDNSLEICNQLHQFVYNLTASPDNEPKTLSGDIAGRQLQQPENASAAILRLSLGVTLGHLFGDLDLAEQLANDRADLKKIDFALFCASVDVLIKGLVAVGQARRGIRSRRNQKIARQCLQRLRALGKDCPDNFLNKQKLLEAEVYSLSGLRKAIVDTTFCQAANEVYGEAYRVALQQGFTHEAALTCELAGDFMHQHEQRGLAKEYWEQAHALYLKWGALAKVRHFRMKLDAVLEN